MKIMLTLLSQTSVTAIGWTLVHSLWQGAVIAIIGAVAWRVLSKQSAALRYNFGIGLLAFQLLASAATFAYYYNTALVASRKPVSTVTLAIPAASNWQEAGYQLSLAAKVQIWLQIHITELVICWLIGAALLMLRFAGGWIYTLYLRRQSWIVNSSEWRTRFGVLTAKLNVSVPIEFRETSQILTPMVIGAFKPVVLIPVGLLTGFSVSQVEAILAHELAHIRRNDYLINMIQSVVEVLYFFHPAIWWLSEKVRDERENCCDDIALETCADKMTLAHALVKVAEWQSAPALAMAFVSKKPLLLQRVRRVLGLSSKSTTPAAAIPAMFLAIGLIVGVSFYSYAQKEKKRAKTHVKTSARKEINTTVTPIQGTLAPIALENHVENPDTSGERNDGKIDSLAQAYHKINPIFSIADIRNELEVLNPIEVDILNAQLVTLSDKVHDQSSEEDYAKIRARMAELQREFDKLNYEVEKISREREKQMFEVERYNRALEKIEWTKQKSGQARETLTEKRMGLLHNNARKGQQKLSDAEIEKQLAEFEEKIKDQEQKIADYNAQLVQVRAEGMKAEEPLRQTEKEIEILEGKMDVIREELEAESRKLQKQGPPPPPMLKLSMEQGTRMAPPPPPPVEPKPAVKKVKKAVPAIPPPPPPVPAKVK